MARILIVGATSAIATATARLYAARGDRLYLLGRGEDKLRTLATDLGESVVGHAAGDFTEANANPDRIRAGFEALGGVDIALVAHGALGDQLESETDYAEAYRQFDANFLSAVSLLIPIANAMEAQGSGTIAVMSSVAAERGHPRNYTYAAAKAGLNTYLEGIRSRLWSRGVRVCILKLGPVDTPMTVDHAKDASFSSKEDVAKEIVRVVDAGTAVAYVPARWRLIMAVVRALPEWIFQKIPSLVSR